MFSHSINLTFEFLSKVKRISIRNKKWFKLSGIEKALFSAALLYSKVKGKIVNLTLIESLLEIIEKIKVGFKTKLILEGLRSLKSGKTHELIPQFKEWVKNPVFIEYLGLIRKSTLKLFNYP